MTATPCEMPALVVAAHGQRGVLETDERERLRFLTKGRRLRPVCGDRVGWFRDDTGDTVIVNSIASRENVLERLPPDGRRPEVLAANLTCLFVVVAPLPQPDWYLVDRYLVAAALMGCSSVLVSNKTDLVEAPTDELGLYSELGYRVLEVSATTGTGLADLEAVLVDEIGILVGQSGVGKSSLINRLVPDAGLVIGKLSAATAEGTHTTAASVMHTLPGGGRLIDTPGVREFIPMLRDPRSAQQGFPEILAAADGCRFKNCRHLREPDCAVKARRDAGVISARRYESYKRVLRSGPGNR